LQKSEKQSPKKGKTSVINWLVPLLLVAAAIATLIFYPAPVPKPDRVPVPTVKAGEEYPTTEIATTLVYTFFNGSNKEREDQIDALTNTLNFLKKDTASPASKKALNALKVSNINLAIQTLIEFSREQYDLRKEAKSWINIGNIQNLTSAEQALRAYEKASELDPENSNAWNRQANIYRRLKQFSKAEMAYKKVQSLENQGETNDALSFANLGLLNQSKGDLLAAEEAFLQALDIYESAKNNAGIASTSQNLASLYIQTKNPKKAEVYYLKALKSYIEQDMAANIATIYSALGSLKQSMNDTEKAQFYYKNALDISLKNNFQDNIANLYSNLGILAQQNGDLEKSKEYFEQSLNLNKDIKRTIATADQYGNLAIINRKKGKFELAEDFHLRAIEIYTEKNHSNGIISQKTNLGFLYKAWKKPDKACEVWGSITEMLRQRNADRAERINQLIQATCPS